MNVKNLDYELPKELLAREPRELLGEKRSDSKLLVMNRKDNSIICDSFNNIIHYFNSGDTVVLNNSQTFNSYLKGVVNDNKKIEFQLCGRNKNNQWQAYIPLDFSLKKEDKISVQNKLTGLLIDKIAPHIWIINFDQKQVVQLANELGQAVNSHYMKQQWNIDYYKNEFASINGSSEMPAAGRHFTNDIINQLKANGINIAFITLHTGLSSIIVEEKCFEDHKMHSEEISLSKENASIINNTKESGHRVIAVGTTVVRTLESIATENGQVREYSGFTDLYIYPGYKFKVVDAFLTNFHGPRSTRIAMAAAFTGETLLKRGYNKAIDDNFKFYEFGDATLTI